MTQRQYSIRIGLDGKAEIDRDFDGIEQKGGGVGHVRAEALGIAAVLVKNLLRLGRLAL